MMKAMKFPRIDMSRLSRETRVGIVTGILVLIGAVALACRWHATGIFLIVLAAALVAAFYFLVARPSRIPGDAILTIRISDGMREDAPRSPLEQLRSRGQPTL